MYYSLWDVMLALPQTMENKGYYEYIMTDLVDLLMLYIGEDIKTIISIVSERNKWDKHLRVKVNFGCLNHGNKFIERLLFRGILPFNIINYDESPKDVYQILTENGVMYMQTLLDEYDVTRYQSNKQSSQTALLLPLLLVPYLNNAKHEMNKILMNNNNYISLEIANIISDYIYIESISIS